MKHIVGFDHPFGSLHSSFASTIQVLQEAVEKRSNQTLDPEVVNRLEPMDRKVDQTMASAKSLVHFRDKSKFRQQFVNPTLSLLSRSSNHTGDPGGKWADLIADLGSRMEAVERSKAQGSTHYSGGVGGSFGWTTSSSNGGGVKPAPPVSFAGTISQTPKDEDSAGLQEEVTRMREEFKELRAEVKDLQDQAETEAIVVGSIVFTTRSFCVSWMTQHNVNADPHVFVDVVSLLSLATSDVSLDEERAANLRATTAKVRDKTPYPTAFIASFNLEVPPLLGKGVDQTQTTNSRALGGAPKFEDFHPPSGREGIHQRILDHVKDGRRTLEQAISDLFAFGTEPASVAHELLLQSKTFWDDLCHWIVRYHQQVKAESEASSQEVWILISHCVRAIFRSLREARAPGRATNTPAGMLWGTLRAHEVMKEYRQSDFSGHPKIALILHEHLIWFATPRSKFSALQSGLEDRMDKLQRSLNSVVPANNKGSSKKS